MLPPFSVRPDAPQPVTKIIRQARQGVLRRRVDEIAGLVGLTDIEMAKILNMSVRGLHGKDNKEVLNLASSERLLLLERLIQRGLAVFDGNADSLSRWLRTPLNELAYREGADEAVEPIAIREAGSYSPWSSPWSVPYGRTPPQTKQVAGAVKTQLTDEVAEPAPVPQTPLSALDTVLGFSLVEDVLGRIEWGIVG